MPLQSYILKMYDSVISNGEEMRLSGEKMLTMNCGLENPLI
jgi:hypothetical protein